MQINSVSPTLAYFSASRTTTPAVVDSSDQIATNLSADTFSSLVKEAGAQPEVRSDVVDSFKARIANGSYPPQDIVDGLSRLIGASVVQLANTQASAGQN